MQKEMNCFIWPMSFLVFGILPFLARGVEPGPEVQSVRAVPAIDSDTAALTLYSKAIAEEPLDFRSCEGIIEGNQDFGLFQVKLAPDDKSGSPHWSKNGAAWSYVWSYPVGITVRFRGEPEESGMRLVYELENTMDRALERVQIHTCITTTATPSFFPSASAPTANPAENGLPAYAELYHRLFLWNESSPFSFASVPEAREQEHLAFMLENEPPVQWAWWVNAEKTFDFPLIAAQSHDGKTVIAVCFEKAIWASSNVGDDRACFHLFPFFERIEPGQKAQIQGKLYILQTDLESLFEQAKKDLQEFGK